MAKQKNDENIPGLLIVHGIGNQKPGVLNKNLSEKLIATKKTHSEFKSFVTRLKNGNTFKRKKQMPLLRRNNLDGKAFLSYEANWASLSNPSNPPKVRHCFDIFKEFLLMVRISFRSVRTKVFSQNRILNFVLKLFYFLLYIVALEIFFFFLIFAILAVVLNGLGIFLTYLLRIISKVFLICRLNLICRWLNRIGWVMIVFPVHIILFAVKSFGNFFSIIFTENKWLVRIIAFFSQIPVFIVTIILLIWSEIIWVFFLIIFVSDNFWVFLGYFSFYLIFFKFSLPILDLLLDIFNYHLSSDEARAEYFEPIEHGVNELLESGCKEIYIFAHSLGTVITFDWLKYLKKKQYPISRFYSVGSPLNKFYYIDHTKEQRDDDLSGLKDGISDQWINFWAISDPISGKLRHFSSEELPVSNIRLRYFGFYFFSHVRYWKNKMVLNDIRDGIRAA